MRVALIGDSHSSYHFNDITDVLEGEGYEVVDSFSRPGWGVKSFLSSNLLDQLIDSKPEAVIVALGGNNHNLTDRYGERVDQFITLLREYGVSGPIVWLGPFEADVNVRPDVWERHEWTSDYLQDFLPSRDVAWIDMRPVSITGPWRDGVHFSRDKYTEMIQGISVQILSGLTGFALSRVLTHPAFLISSFVILVGSLTIGYYFSRK